MHCLYLETKDQNKALNPIPHKIAKYLNVYLMTEWLTGLSTVLKGPCLNPMADNVFYVFF